MIPLWVYIGLAAQFLWVLGAIIDKGLLEKYFPEKLDGSAGTLLVISGAFSGLLALGIYLFFFDEISFSLSGLLLGLLTGVLNGIWLHLYLVATHEAEVSRTVPIFQSIPIFGLIFAFFALGETLAPTEITAILLVLSGAFVLSFDWKSREWLLKPTIFMLIASATVALQETLFKVVSESSSYWNAVLWLATGTFVYALLLLIVSKSIRSVAQSTFLPHTRAIWGISIVNEVLDNAAYLLFVFAITLGPVALVQSVNAFQPLILLIAATILARYFGNKLKEDVSYQSLAQKVLGVLIITIGSYMLYTVIT